MARPRKVISLDEMSRLNSLRKINSGKVFSRPEIVSLLKEELGWKQSRIIEQVLNKVLIKPERGKYSFPKEPIYIGKIQNIFDANAQRRKMLRNASKPEENHVNKAISLLKSLGYTITRKTFDADAAFRNPDMLVKEFIKITEF